jgi:hypothetical protein
MKTWWLNRWDHMSTRVRLGIIATAALILFPLIQQQLR